MSEKYKIKSFDDGKIILSPPPPKPPPPHGAFITTWYGNGHFDFGIGGDIEGTIDWGDGSAAESVKGDTPQPHTYTFPTERLVSIVFTGHFSTFNVLLDAGAALIKINDWGSVGLTQFSARQINSIEYINPALPDSLKSMKNAFSGITSFPDISKLEVGNVEDMESMFEGCSTFDQNISDWNVSNVTEMSSMFKECLEFNQNISDWNVSKVTEMSSMFKGCINFNQNLSSWIMMVTKDDGMIFNITNPDWIPAHKPIVNGIQGGRIVIVEPGQPA